jgi:hypothetical protein
MAIKEALVYKNSYLSLMQNRTSRISNRSKDMMNNDYLNGDIGCQSQLDDSFINEANKMFSG